MRSPPHDIMCSKVFGVVIRPGSMQLNPQTRTVTSSVERAEPKTVSNECDGPAPSSDAAVLSKYCESCRAVG
eukprot:scaffold10050_cov143-Isochrysis_galbana.AAC.1